MPPASTNSSAKPKPAAKRPAARTKASTARAPRTAAASRTTTRSARTANASTSVSTASYAERAVLIPVGAALIARDQVVSSVNDAISSYASPAKARRQLNRFERRGATARNRLEREIRKTRTRLERELRQRRSDGSEFVDRLQERVLNRV
jgi:hypothetical protein